jgi:hypothetical protein
MQHCMHDVYWISKSRLSCRLYSTKVDLLLNSYLSPFIYLLLAIPNLSLSIMSSRSQRFLSSPARIGHSSIIHV